MPAEHEQQIADLQNELANTRREYHDYVYAVSHDLNAVLRQIEGFTELVRSSSAADFDEKTSQYFNLIIDGCNKSQNILDALLTFSRLHSLEKVFELVDCDEIVSTVANELASLSPTIDAHIHCDPLPEIRGCKEDIHKVFFNLLQNALLYHRENEQITIDINVIEREACWEFCIKDNGIGMSERATQTVFAPLKRAVSEKNYPGAGMGLTIAESIVRYHNGRIWIESEKGVGTRAYFTFYKQRSARLGKKLDI